MGRKAVNNGKSGSKEKEPTSVTIPADLLKWARDHTAADDTTLSALVVTLLKREKREVEKRSGPPPRLD
jgi:hypothetical protein